MLKTKNKLTVLHDDNSSFADYSREALDYARDTFSTTIVALEDAFYIGFYKPINVFFVEFSTANTNANTLTGEFWNGSAWTSLDGLFDETNGFTRSGFIQWDRGQDDEAKTTVNSTEQYWYKFTFSADHSATTFKGVNIVFSDDNDLKKEFFEISEFLPSGESSFILTHVATRDHIIQKIRNGGTYKQLNGTKKDITAFDLLDLSQVKLASTYLTLSKIFSNVQDDVDDIWRQKSIDYKDAYDAAERNGFLSIDLDDDGKADGAEVMRRRDIRVNRI